jgi:hypothetical protein
MSLAWPREEAPHGTKWGYVVVAVVIMIVISLLGAIFYLIGEGIRKANIEGPAILLYTGIVVVIGIIIALAAVKVGWMAMATFTGFFTKIWSLIWALFSNIYILIIAVVLMVIMISALFFSFVNSADISLANPVVIGILVVLLIAFFPFAIFLIDLFSLEEE